MIIKKGDKGIQVEDIQIALAGFGGTVWDGDFGNGTENQVKKFQKDFMKISPTGIVDQDTIEAIQRFESKYVIDWKKLKCQCKKCDGFGNGRFLGQYRNNVKVNDHYMYERPGIHRVILSMIRYAMFVNPKKVYISCGYRCEYDNERAGRKSNNHKGNAVDLDIMEKINDHKIDMQNCDNLRKLLVDNSNCQIGWALPNKKSLESKELASTWVHCDIREYSESYLADRFYIKG